MTRKWTAFWFESRVTTRGCRSEFEYSPELCNGNKVFGLQCNGNKVFGLRSNGNKVFGLRWINNICQRLISRKASRLRVSRMGSGHGGRGGRAQEETVVAVAAEAAAEEDPIKQADLTME